MTQCAQTIARILQEAMHGRDFNPELIFRRISPCTNLKVKLEGITGTGVVRS
jgi:hypothetical protein